MFAILLILSAMPPQDTTVATDLPPQDMTACVVCTTASHCGCVDGGACCCTKYSSYAEWRRAVSRKRRRDVTPAFPVIVVPSASFTAIPTMNVPIGFGTFGSGTVCAGGG